MIVLITEYFSALCVCVCVVADAHMQIDYPSDMQIFKFSLGQDSQSFPTCNLRCILHVSMFLWCLS